MLILIDRDELRMVAAASNRRWLNLIGYCDFPGKQLVVVDSLEGKTWTVLDAEEMSTLYKNMSGQDAPPYSQAIEQLRSYADTWPNYVKSEAELEREAEAIYQEEQSTEAEAALAGISRETHQACIEAAESAREAMTPEQREQVAQAAPKPEPSQSSSAPAERPRQGVTKRIWEIADELLAVTGKIGNLKEFRLEVINRASAEGANAGTAATQFGRWKTAKGL